MRSVVVLALLTSTAAAAPHAIEVAASEGRVCALLDDGTVRCWGDSFDNDGEHHTPVAIAGVSKATDLALSLSSACVRHADKTATCWGDTSFLEMDSKTTTAHAAPVLSRADALAFAGTGDGCAKYADG